MRSGPPMTVPRVCGHSPPLSMNTSSLCISVRVSKLNASSRMGTATIPSCSTHTCKIAHVSMAKALNGRMLDSSQLMGGGPCTWRPIRVSHCGGSLVMEDTMAYRMTDGCHGACARV